MSIPNITLGSLVRALPNIRPKLALAKARDAVRAHGLLDRSAGERYPAAEERAGEYGGFIICYPAGVRRVIDWYREGVLPLKVRTAPGSVPEHIARLAAMSDSDIAAHEADELLSYDVINDAYWRWVERECPDPPGSEAAFTWRRATPFVFRGVRYEREKDWMRSNSGKRVVADRTIYRGVDGTVFESEPQPGPNRRNDPDRDFGLPRSRGWD